MSGRSHASPKVGVSPGSSVGVGRTLNSSGTKSDSGSLSSPKIAPSASKKPAAAFPCDSCNRSYQSRSALVKHSLTCAATQRRHCQYCDAKFANFRSLRTHERKSHEDAYLASLEGKLPLTDAEIFSRLAAVEARAKKGAPFVAEMVAATGLTKDQIRHRRLKPQYKEYLDRARQSNPSDAALTQPSTSSSASVNIEPSSPPALPRRCSCLAQRLSLMRSLPP